MLVLKDHLLTNNGNIKPILKDQHFDWILFILRFPHSADRPIVLACPFFGQTFVFAL